MKKRLQQLAGLKSLYEQEGAKQEAPMEEQLRILGAVKQAFNKLELEVESKIKGYSPIREDHKKVRKLIKSVIKEAIQKKELKAFINKGKISPSIQSAVDAWCVNQPEGTPIPPEVIGLPSDFGTINEHYQTTNQYSGPGQSHYHFASNAIMYCNPNAHVSTTGVIAKKCNSNGYTNSFNLDPTNAPNGPHWKVGDVFETNSGNSWYIVQVYSSLSTTSNTTVTPVSPSPGYCCGCAFSCDNIPNVSGGCSQVPFWPTSTWQGQTLWITYHGDPQWAQPATDPHAAVYSGPSGECYTYSSNDSSCVMPTPCCNDSQATNYDPNCYGSYVDNTLCSYFKQNPTSYDYGINILGASIPVSETLISYFIHIQDMIDADFTYPVICEWLQDKLDDVISHPSFNNTQQQNPMNWAFYLNQLADYIQNFMMMWFGCNTIYDDPILFDPVINPNTGFSFVLSNWTPGFINTVNSQTDPCTFLENKINTWQSSLANVGPAQSAMLNQKIAFAQNLCQQNTCPNC